MTIRRAIAGVGLLALAASLTYVVHGMLTSLPVAVSPTPPPESSPPEPPHAALGIRVRGGQIVEANGRELVLRGVNHAYAWFPERNSSFADIKATGANSVRVSLATGHQWGVTSAADVAGVVSRCRQNRLICVFDAHDTMGLGETGGAATLAEATDYWLSVQSALTGQENYVIVNIGNEPYGNYHYRTWVVDTAAAIRRLRAAGFLHTLMVDAPDWGQDLSFTMRDNARAVLAADPSGNTVFSVHMYGVFNTGAKVGSYMASFVKRGLPLVVGEFAYMHKFGDPAEDAIMAYAQTNRLGYFGWSWSGNDREVGYLDMVNDFDPSRRTPWGNRFINGPNGLSTTSREASVYRPGRQRA